MSHFDMFVTSYTIKWERYSIIDVKITLMNCACAIDFLFVRAIYLDIHKESF